MRCEIIVDVDHNQIFRLDGENIKTVDNGFEGVFFNFKSSYSQIVTDRVNLNKSVNYFSSGLNWQQFIESKSYINKYLINRTNFAVEEKYGLTADEQKYLYLIYFYSLFFESLLEEKPILCWQGVKASGKTTSATLIGRILFGDFFRSSHLPVNIRDFNVSLAENYYIIFDNLDTYINQHLDPLCAAATGAEITTRKLYTNNEEIKIRPKVFIVLTSREPKFKRDDVVDRLLLFNTAKVDKPISRSVIFKDIERNRDQIWGEIFVNINSIIQLLKKKRAWSPECIFRIADWETFCRKVIADKDMNILRGILAKMNKEKSIFGLEDDPLYILLHHRLNERNSSITDLTASDLYSTLEGEAILLKMHDFTRRYKGAVALGRRIANIKEDLSGEFNVEIREGRSHIKLYNFSRKIN